jgi:hypothetical protein
MKRVIAFLQNAWSPLYAGGTWPRKSWLKALDKSRSGQRLRVLTGSAHPVEIVWENTTPIVGATPDSIIEPDEAHIKRVLRMYRVDGIITLGRQAAEAVTELAYRYPVMQLPHPAHRLVTNELYEQAGFMVSSGFSVIVVLRQGRG